MRLKLQVYKRHRKIPYFKSMGTLLASARKEKEISSGKMAKLISCSPPTLSRIESGCIPCPPKYLRRMKKILGLQVADILAAYSDDRQSLVLKEMNALQEFLEAKEGRKK